MNKNVLAKLRDVVIEKLADNYYSDEDDCKADILNGELSFWGTREIQQDEYVEFILRIYGMSKEEVNNFIEETDDVSIYFKAFAVYLKMFKHFDGSISKLADIIEENKEYFGFTLTDFTNNEICNLCDISNDIFELDYKDTPQEYLVTDKEYIEVAREYLKNQVDKYGNKLSDRDIDKLLKQEEKNISKWKEYLASYFEIDGIWDDYESFLYQTGQGYLLWELDGSDIVWQLQHDVPEIVLIQEDDGYYGTVIRFANVNCNHTF